MNAAAAAAAAADVFGKAGALDARIHYHISLTETDLTELTRSVLLGRSVKLGDNEK